MLEVRDGDRPRLDGERRELDAAPERFGLRESSSQQLFSRRDAAFSLADCIRDRVMFVRVGSKGVQPCAVARVSGAKPTRGGALKRGHIATNHAQQDARRNLDIIQPELALGRSLTT